MFDNRAALITVEGKVVPAIRGAVSWVTIPLAVDTDSGVIFVPQSVALPATSAAYNPPNTFGAFDVMKSNELIADLHTPPSDITFSATAPRARFVAAVNPSYAAPNPAPIA